MVTLHFKLSDRGTIELEPQTKETWQQLLLRCPGPEKLTPDSVLAVRRGTVVAAEDIIFDNDIIDVFPALSGG